MDDSTQLNEPTRPDFTIPHGAFDADLTQAAAHVSSEAPPIAISKPIYTPPPLPTQWQPPLTAPNGFGRPVQRSNWLYVLIAVGVLLIAFLFSMGALVYRQVLNAQTEAPTAAEIVAAGQGAITATPFATQPITPEATATQGLTIQPWDGKQRFTMLLMGIDKRPGESGTAFRTDTLMIVSLDPVTHSIGVLSVPRDLFVTIPPNTVVGNSYGLQRINSAYTIGELARPGYGAQLAVQTVQYNMGIRINDYVVVEFGTVIGAVDTVGGVDIDVPAPINDPEYPDMNFGYSPLHIPAGHIHMDGTLALKYARSRHESSDLDRAKRQQQVILAIRDKVLSLNMAPQLITQAPAIWSQLNSGIHTDLTLEQLIQLGLYAKDVPKENVHQGVVDYGYVTSQVWQGMDILVPNRAAIGPLMVKVFGAGYNG